MFSAIRPTQTIASTEATAPTVIGITTTVLAPAPQQQPLASKPRSAARPQRLIRRSVAAGRPNGRVRQWKAAAAKRGSGERRGLAAGKGQGLRGFVEQPIEKQGGIRFDVPLQQQARGRRSGRFAARGAALSGRPNGRVPRWRGNAKYNEQRRLMRAGKGQRLAALHTQPIEKKNGTRFDIPLSGAAPMAFQQQAAFQQQQQFQQFQQFQQPMMAPQAFQPAPPPGQIISKDRQGKYTVVTQASALPPMMSQPVVAPVGFAAAPTAASKLASHQAHHGDKHNSTIVG